VPEHRGQKTRTGKTIEPNSIEKQGSASLRCPLPSQGLRSLVDCTPFLAYNHKDILPNLPPTGSWGSEHKYRTWHLSLRCIYPPPSNLSILYPQSQRRAIPFRFSFLSVQHISFAIVLFYDRKIVIRVHSYFIMLCLSFAIAAIHYANTAKNCQIVSQLLHSTAQRTRRAETNFFKVCRQHEEESDICDSKDQKVEYSWSSTCHDCRILMKTLDIVTNSRSARTSFWKKQSRRISKSSCYESWIITRE